MEQLRLCFSGGFFHLAVLDRPLRLHLQRLRWVDNPALQLDGHGWDNHQPGLRFKPEGMHAQWFHLGCVQTNPAKTTLRCLSAAANAVLMGCGFGSDESSRPGHHHARCCA